MLEPAIAVNSMLIKDRPVEDVFELARVLESRFEKQVYVDLRSKRHPETDPHNLWKFVHTNSSFDIYDKRCVEQVIELSRKNNIKIIAVSAYFDASHDQDFTYGIEIIKNAAALGQVAPQHTVILRFLGGNASSHQEKQIAIARLNEWLEFANTIFHETGNKVILGLEIHQGNWPQTIAEATEFKRMVDYNIPAELHDFFGIIDDQANRYIAAGELLTPITKQLENAFVYFHIKDVKFLQTLQPESESNFQHVGEREFTFSGKKFSWELPNEGDVKLSYQINFALKYANPPHNIIGFSTEHVLSSNNNEEAKNVVLDYGEKIYAAIEAAQNLITR